MDNTDDRKRKALQGAAAVLGAAGIAGVATPFLSYLSPGKAAQAAGAPVKVDLASMQPGQQKTVLWRGKPVWIIRRTPEMIASLSQTTALVSDPNSEIDQQPIYAKNEQRSIKPEFLVLLGVCTHLGCSPTFRPEPKSIDAQWQGGFYCSCHGSRFDLSGRVYKNVPAPINLEVPEYHYENDNTIIIGVSPSNQPQKSSI